MAALTQLKVISDPSVIALINTYPESARQTLLRLRELVLTTADEIAEITRIEETLKWGEPSFLTKFGSTLRMDWKEKKPEYVCLYFKCTSKLVPTFKAVYGSLFKFEKNRAISFKIGEKIPELELKRCISMTLRYHKLKHLPYLGARL